MWFRAAEDTCALEIMSLKTIRTNVHFSKMSADIIKSICGFALEFKTGISIQHVIYFLSEEQPVSPAVDDTNPVLTDLLDSEFT